MKYNPNRKRGPKTSRKTKKKVVSQPKAVVAIVKRELAKAIENKLIMENGLLNTPISNGLGGNYVQSILPRIDTTSTYPVLPKLNVGTEAYQRVGTSVKPLVIKIKGTIYYSYDTPAIASRDLSVRLMILTNKSSKFMPDLVANPTNLYTNTLLWNGQVGDSTAYQGCQPYYNTLPINNRQWNVITDRKYNMLKGLGTGAVPSNGEVFLSGARSHQFEIVLTSKHLPASLKYDGGLGTVYPTNYAPVMYMGFVDNTGEMIIGDTNSDRILDIQYTVTMIYEDA